MNNQTVTIVGAGLAGCEAAWQLVQRGVPVRLIDMKPIKYSPAHKAEGFAELVCSNSLKAEHLTNASGLLKAEMKEFNSLILSAADTVRCSRSRNKGAACRHWQRLPIDLGMPAAIEEGHQPVVKGLVVFPLAKSFSDPHAAHKGADILRRYRYRSPAHAPIRNLSSSVSPRSSTIRSACAFLPEKSSG